MKEIEITVSSRNAKSLGVVAPEFVSSTLDWWPPTDEAWGNSSVINADLSHPNLLAAAKGLSPFFLRVGGSQADEIIYNFPKATDNNSSVKVAAKACKKRPQQCLTVERWNEVLNFAHEVGARIVFTIAYVRHTRDDDKKDDVRDWDSTNAKQFLEYTANSLHGKLGTVYGVELGNELRHGNKVSNVTRIVKAYNDLGQFVNEIWDQQQYLTYPKPKIMGPASTGATETAALLSSLGPYLDIATYHKYQGGGKDKMLQVHAQQPWFFAHPYKYTKQSEAVETYMSSSPRPPDANSEKRVTPPQVWVGEGAMAYNSGRQGVTDSFQSSLWFANLLGAISKTKPYPHSVYCRQALIGGYYELISHETMKPNPDYFVAYLWKHIVGTKAIGPIRSSSQRQDSPKLSSQYTFGCCNKPGKDQLLIHAFCAINKSDEDGDMVFIVINISKSTPFKLSIPMGDNRTEYVLTPNENGYRSRKVLLNDTIMKMKNGKLSAIDGAFRTRHENSLVPPISIAFLVVHGANITTCRSTTINGNGQIRPSNNVAPKPRLAGRLENSTSTLQVPFNTASTTTGSVIIPNVISTSSHAATINSTREEKDFVKQDSLVFPKTEMQFQNVLVLLIFLTLAMRAIRFRRKVTKNSN